VRCGQPPERHRKQASIPVANAEVGYHDAPTHRFIHDADRLQGLERPGVYNGRAGMPGGPVRPVQHDGPDPVRGEHGSRREPDRSCPDHGDFYLVVVGLRAGRSNLCAPDAFVTVHLVGPFRGIDGRSLLP
jgi:hypothetical protein